MTGIIFSNKIFEFRFPFPLLSPTQISIKIATFYVYFLSFCRLIELGKNHKSTTCTHRETNISSSKQQHVILSQWNKTHTNLQAIFNPFITKHKMPLHIIVIIFINNTHKCTSYRMTRQRYTHKSICQNTELIWNWSRLKI